MSSNMNFIAKWCHERCGVDAECSKCSAECKPRAVLSDQTCISEHLLWILQNQRGGITHPNIADRIADYIGSTPAERDTIVHRRHRGTYIPNPKNPGLKRNKPKPSEPWRPGTDTCAVVAIDENGKEVARYSSMNNAAVTFGCDYSAVRHRCDKTITYSDEFTSLGISFRYYGEWKNLSAAERKEDIEYIKRRNAANRKRRIMKFV